MMERATRDSRRAVLQRPTGLFAGTDAVLLSIPFIGSMVPDSRVKARGEPTNIDVSSLASGQQLTTTQWGKPA